MKKNYSVTGGGDISGRGGYFFASVGAVDEDAIRQYIENQQWNDPGENFKITAPTEA